MFTPRSVLALLLVFAMMPAAPFAAAAPYHLGQESSARSEDDSRRVQKSPLLSGDAQSLEEQPFVAGEVIVKFRQDRRLSAADKSAIHGKARGARAEKLGKTAGLELVALETGVEVRDAVYAYMRDPGVEYAQPNYRYQADAVTEAVPSDPEYGDLWGLENIGQNGGVPDADIDASTAWGYTTGSEDVVVAVIDSGIAYNHPDLQDNMWVNAMEAVGISGVDDDSNGLVDDVHGYDFIAHDGDPMDDTGHGTHCAGTIGATGNNGIDVVGVNWDVSLMAVKVLDKWNYTNTASTVEGIEYADMMGADILNCSWGGDPYDTVLRDALAACEALVVCSAGNDAEDVDIRPTYPSGYDLSNIISVAASDRSDALADFSNFGAQEVDLAAPGDEVTSTVRGAEKVPLWQDDLSTLDDWDVTQYVNSPWVTDNDNHFGDPPSLSNRYPGNNEEAEAKIGPFDLSSDDSYRLFAEYYWDLEPGDYFRIYVSTDNVNWDHFASLSGCVFDFYTNTRLWLDLDAYAGSPEVWVAYVMATDASVTSPGVWMDDFFLYSGTPTPLDYGTAPKRGTSMAAPHVAGVAALLKAYDPSLTTAEVKYAILATVDVKQAFTGVTLSNGRLNAGAALDFVAAGASDSSPPLASDDVADTYDTEAVITLLAHDEPGGSGVDWIAYRLDGEETVTVHADVVTVNVAGDGDHTLDYLASDHAGNHSAPINKTFTIHTPVNPVIDIQGTSRYDTAVAASLEAYPAGLDPAGDKTVIIATGRNWPDALGGAALAGVVDGPVLLVDTTSVPAVVMDEIGRLGASKAYILGGTGAVGTAVENALKTELGPDKVERIGGANRYETANDIAAKVKQLRGSDYDGGALVATAANFPDALAAAPLAVKKGWPLYLSHPKDGLSAETRTAMAGTTEVLILGGAGAVPSSAETYLKGQLGSTQVTRLAGASRYETAAKIATHAVTAEGHFWNRAGIATGQNFPDALAGGVLQGKVGSVMLLTLSTSLSPETEATLIDNSSQISTVTFFGGSGAVSQAVRDSARSAAGIIP